MVNVMDAEQKVDKEVEIPDNLPVLPVRDIVVFPYMILPLFVGREMSIKAIEFSLSSNRMVLLLTQKDHNIENPAPEDLFSVGTVALVMRMLKLPDGRVKILVQGLSKAKALNYSQTEPFFKADIEKIEDQKYEKLTIEDEALIRNVKGQLDKVVSLGKSILPDIMGIVENIEDPGGLRILLLEYRVKNRAITGDTELTDPSRD
jgi:ATP-dependent Lon protease